jgi:hypothetical protein
MGAFFWRGAKKSLKKPLIFGRSGDFLRVFEGFLRVFEATVTEAAGAGEEDFVSGWHRNGVTFWRYGGVCYGGISAKTLGPERKLRRYACYACVDEERQGDMERGTIRETDPLIIIIIYCN